MGDPLGYAGSLLDPSLILPEIGSISDSDHKPDTSTPPNLSPFYYYYLEFGKQAKEYVSKGKVVPDDLVNKLLINTLSQKEFLENHLLLDGMMKCFYF